MRMRVCMLGYTFYETDSRVRQYAKALRERGDEVDFHRFGNERATGGGSCRRSPHISDSAAAVRRERENLLFIQTFALSGKFIAAAVEEASSQSVRSNPYPFRTRLSGFCSLAGQADRGENCARYS